MSSDDYIGIVQVLDKFIGYRLSASQPIPTMKELEHLIPKFVSASIVDAILDAQDANCEYGYTFFNLKRN